MKRAASNAYSWRPGSDRINSAPARRGLFRRGLQGQDPALGEHAAQLGEDTVEGDLAYLGWEMWRLWLVAAGDGRAATPAALRASTRVLLVLPLLVMTWVWSWYFSWSLVLAALLGWQSRLARLVVVYTLCALPVVYAHQYLNERLPGVFVIAFALVPLVSLLAGRPSTQESSVRPRSRSPCRRASGSRADT